MNYFFLDPKDDTKPISIPLEEVTTRVTQNLETYMQDEYHVFRISMQNGQLMGKTFYGELICQRVSKMTHVDVWSAFKKWDDKQVSLGKKYSAIELNRLDGKVILYQYSEDKKRDIVSQQFDNFDQAYDWFSV